MPTPAGVSKALDQSAWAGEAPASGISAGCAGDWGIPLVISTSGLRMGNIQVFKLQLSFYFIALGLMYTHNFAPIHRAKGLLKSPCWTSWTDRGVMRRKKY